MGTIYDAVGQGVKSIADFDRERDVTALNRLQMLTAQGQYDQQQRGVDDDNALRAIYTQAGGDLNKAKELAGGQGLYKAVGSIAKQQQDAATAQADAAYKAAQTEEAKAKSRGLTLDQSIKNHDFQVQKLGALATPDQVPAWIADNVQSGVMSFQQASDSANRFKQAASQPGFDFNAWKNQALQGGVSATDQVKNAQALLTAREQNATSRANNFDTNATSRANNSATVGATMRGQNMVDARTRESTAATLTKPFEVTGPDGQPLLVQQDKQGNIAPVTGYTPKGGSSKPLNDSQAKALGFGTRMQEADKTLGQLSAKGVNTPSLVKQGVEGIPVVGGMLGTAANAFVASPEQQQVEQAQRDFVNAVLRRESGAAISPSEFDNAKKQYFDQPGDAAPVKAQKAANRKLAAEGVMAEVPKGQRGTIGPQSGADLPPDIAAILAKHGAR